MHKTCRHLRIRCCITLDVVYDLITDIDNVILDAINDIILDVINDVINDVNNVIKNLITNVTTLSSCQMLIESDKNFWDSLLHSFHENEILEVRTRLRIQNHVDELLLWD